MNKLLLCLPLALVACTSAPADPADAAPELRAAYQDGDSAGAAGMDEVAAMMRYMTPGDHHAQLARQCGTYDVEAKVWAAPGAEPMAMTAKATSRMILGGRYMVEDLVGTMAGMPIEGRSTTGYNNITEEWWSTWIDNMSTGHSYSAGKADEDGVITLEGSMVDHVSPEGRWFGMVLHPAREDGSYQADMLGKWEDGSRWTVMEMQYTPVKE